MSVIVDVVMSFLGCLIAYDDYKHKAIWNYQIALLFIAVMVSAWMHDRVINFLYGGLIASAINLLIFCGTFLFYKSEQYGFGDVMIHICIGGYLGIEKYLNYYLFSSVVLGIVAVGMLIYYRQNKAIPLVPWLFGCLLVYLASGTPDIFAFNLQ